MDIKDFVCRAPFEDFMVFDSETWFCCPDWMELDNATQIESHDDLKSIWFNDLNTKIRKSILKGEYKYCSKERCPYLSKIVNSSKEELDSKHKSKYTHTEYFEMFYKKEVFLKKYKVDNFEWKIYPRLIYFNFDLSCNYQCPSCRLQTIPNKKDKRVSDIIKSINKQFAETVQAIHVTGSGDPFYSNAFRQFLQNFKPKNYPNLKNIFLATNGSMWNEEMWGTMKSIHPFVNVAEVSIDAATKDTYENKTRLNGNWEKLLDNLKFIAKLNLNSITLSFVVQDHNVHEMVKFKQLIRNIFKGTKFTIMYRSIQDWRHQSKEWYIERNVADPEHPLHSVLLEQLSELGNANFIQHNMWHLFKEQKSLI